MNDSRQFESGELIVSRYRVVGVIDRGGMGIVYEAVDEQLQRRVAVKVLPADTRADPERLDTFRGEALTLSALNHPHIVTIYEVGQANGTPFIVMELVEGQTLGDRLRSGRLSASEALDIGLQVARALAAAHAKGIVHRDIKPDNLMIRDDGYVKVLDFGIAVLRPQPPPGQSLVAATRDNATFVIAGTPAYTSPEQIEGRALDGRADQFSLGVTLCEALTGENPFLRNGVLDTLTTISQTPAPAEAGVTPLPKPLRKILLRLLQKAPADRYRSTTDLVDALQVAAREIEGSGGGRVKRWQIAVAAVALAALIIVALTEWHAAERRRWVRDEAIPEIAGLSAHEKSAAAFPLIGTAEEYLAGDPELVRATTAATRVATVRSSPPGAVVEVKDYAFPAESWLKLGTTPLEHVRIPAGYLRWRVTKEGVAETVSAPVVQDTMTFDLDRAAKAPKGMVAVEGGMFGDWPAFLGPMGYDLPPFYIDRFEVTNRDYQAFVDNGGYTNPAYWKQPFTRDGRALSFADAMALFRDSTGRAGPSTWEAGHYPAGKGDFPVSGVSWFEAAAYAEFAGKSLPVIAQFGKTTPNGVDKYVGPLSNGSETIAPVGQFQGLGPYGTYDMVGNVREWYWNGTGQGQRFLLGRLASSYGPEALSPFDRSPLNGFRCVVNEGPMPEDARAPRALIKRDFSKVRPATDDVFAIYRSMYAYDKTPLDAVVEPVADPSEDWSREKITFNTAYGHERMWAYLFLPKRARPPYQVVVFFPSARINGLPDSTKLGDLTFMDYVVKSGRAVVYPVYEYQYERAANAPRQVGPTFGRDVMIAWSKDLGRTIDYLETRSDIDAARIGYLGVSVGSAYGVILTALEDRIKAVVLLDGGYFQTPDPLPGTDQVDFAPRLKKPVLMVNGRYDWTFPLADAQAPLFDRLGTPSADKRHVVFDTPHDVRLRRAELVKEVLAWYDRYLGTVH